MGSRYVFIVVWKNFIFWWFTIIYCFNIAKNGGRNKNEKIVNEIKNYPCNQ